MGSLFEGMMQIWIDSNYNDNIEQFEKVIIAIVTEICQKVSDKI